MEREGKKSEKGKGGRGDFEEAKILSLGKCRFLEDMMRDGRKEAFPGRKGSVFAGERGGEGEVFHISTGGREGWFCTFPNRCGAWKRGSVAGDGGRFSTRFFG